MACFPGVSTRFGPEIRFPISIYSPKTQNGDGEHQKLGNLNVMPVVFTPKSLLYGPSFIFPKSCGLLSGGASTRFRPQIRFPISIYSPKNAIWRRWSSTVDQLYCDGCSYYPKKSVVLSQIQFSRVSWPKVEQLYCDARSFYSKKSDLLSQFHFSRVLWPAFRVRALDWGPKSVFQIQFTRQKRDLATVITKSWATLLLYS